MNTELGPKEIEPTYEEADIPSLAAALTIYVTGFSKPPFNEKWEVKEGDLNPEDPSNLNNFLNNVLHEPSELIIKSNGDDKQITQFKDIVFETEYPLNKIIVPYVKALKDPDSLLLLKGSSNDVYKLSEGERINENTSPRAVARFVNYPNEKITELSNEISEYVQAEDINKVMEDLLDAKRALYLGEIVNLDDNLIKQGSFSRQSLKIYLEKYGQTLPDRVMYLTKPGTGVERQNDKENLNRRFMKALIERCFPRGTKFDHKRFAFDDSVGEKVIIYLSKIDEIA